jgi:uncharacterized membrane protein YfcA
MSIQEKHALTTLLSSIVITLVYTAYQMQSYPPAEPYAPEILRFWGVFLLTLIPVSIVAKIVIYILFSILNTVATQEEEPSITDERDQLIESKANQNAMYVFIMGFFLGMVPLAAGLPPALMFSILLCSGLVSELVSEISKFYYYRRGF